MSVLTTVNKEIFALFSIVLFARYLENRSKRLLLLVLLSSIMARWEQAAIIMFFLFAEKAFRRRGRALIFLIALMTIAAPVVYSHVDPELYAGYTEGGRTMLVLDAIQGHFGYFLVVIPKALMNLFGNVAAPWTYSHLWANGFFDAQNQLLIRGHEVAMTCLAAWLLITRRITLHSSLIFFSAIYMIVISANMFVQSRYFYPVFIALAIEMAKTKYSTSATDDLAAIKNRAVSVLP
jgi:hypothetical protein